MHFIRVTGCNVGRFPNPLSPPKTVSPELLVIQRDVPNHSICASYSGENFICDTDYSRVIKRVTAQDIVESTHERSICFTGGEPMIYALKFKSIILELVEKRFQVNIETSGTLPIPKVISDNAWVTCSPKYGFLESNVHHIDELKFVVSVDTSAEAIGMMEDLSERVGTIRGGYTYIQPVNGLAEVSEANVRYCLDLLTTHPRWRLSVQLHKLLNVE